MNGSRSIFEQEKSDRDPTKLGLSSSGHCPRQLYYRRSGAEGIPLSWRSRSIFSDGNYIQDQIRQWIHLSPHPDCYYLADEEGECSLRTPKGREIVGHVDGVIRHHTSLLGVDNCADPAHYERLLEVKSMGSIGFKMLHREGLEKSYLTQVCCYLKALDLPEALVVCKCKDTSELAELVVKRDDALVAEALDRFDQVLDADRPDMVQRMYGEKKDHYLPWQCSYCPFWRTCWAERGPVEKAEHKILLTVGNS